MHSSQISSVQSTAGPQAFKLAANGSYIKWNRPPYYIIFTFTVQKQFHASVIMMENSESTQPQSREKKSTTKSENKQEEAYPAALANLIDTNYNIAAGQHRNIAQTLVGLTSPPERLNNSMKSISILPLRQSRLQLPPLAI